jgi:hypothetical protein
MTGVIDGIEDKVANRLLVMTIHRRVLHDRCGDPAKQRGSLERPFDLDNSLPPFVEAYVTVGTIVSNIAHRLIAGELAYHNDFRRTNTTTSYEREDYQKRFRGRSHIGSIS